MNFAELKHFCELRYPLDEDLKKALEEFAAEIRQYMTANDTTTRILKKILGEK